MSISISYNLSLDAALFLCNLSDWAIKYPKGDPNETKEASDQFNNIPRTNIFVTNARQLERQGFLYHDRDKNGGAINWIVTPKGHAMAEVVRREMQEVRSAFRLTVKSPRQLTKNLTPEAREK